MAEAHIVVVGSTNTDLTVFVDALPRPGETALGRDLLRAAGGKGANQAVAAARAGARVVFVGRVGDDEFGRAALDGLRNEGIDTSLVSVDERLPSGVALIMVDRKGENLIAVASGANARLSPRDVRRARGLIAAADLVLLQLEVPVDAVREAVGAARTASARVLLNPSPAPPAGEAEGLLSGLDYVTPNLGEGRRLTGRPDGGPEEVASALCTAGVGAVFLTLGAAGVCVCEGDNCLCLPAPAVEAVDTVGAGDCFAGALAVALAEGTPPMEAARFATAAAALSVQKAGAQPSLPRRPEIEALLKIQSRERTRNNHA